MMTDRRHAMNTFLLHVGGSRMVGIATDGTEHYEPYAPALHAFLQGALGFDPINYLPGTMPFVNGQNGVDNYAKVRGEVRRYADFLRDVVDHLDAAAGKVKEDDPLAAALPFVTEVAIGFEGKQMAGKTTLSTCFEALLLSAGFSVELVQGQYFDKQPDVLLIKGKGAQR